MVGGLRRTRQESSERGVAEESRGCAEVITVALLVIGKGVNVLV